MEIQEARQFKYDAWIPSDDTLEWSKKHFYETWPELQSFDSNIHFVYAGVNFAYSFSHRTSESIAKEITIEYNNGKTNFIFECLFEGLQKENLDRLHDALELIPDLLPKISIIYGTGDLNPEESYDFYCKRYNRKKLIKVVAAAMFEKSSHKFIEFSLPYINRLKPKKFLCFNKLERQHRIDLISKLLELDLFKDGYVSFQIDKSNLDIILNSTCDIYEPLRNKAHLLPFRLNDLTNRSNPVDVRMEDLEYFQTSHFSIVTETLFYNIVDENFQNHGLKIHVNEVINGSFFSEKLYKCIALRHPFIMLAPQNYLKTLRNRGYKTFSPYINETYDDIYNDDDRFSCVVDEINRLCKLSDSELLEFTDKVKDIVEFNFEHFKNLKDFRVTKNILDLLK